MPPKRSDLVHVTFHFYRSAVLLSLPNTTTVTALKAALLPALQPFSGRIPVPIPSSVGGIRLYDDKPVIEGSQEVGGLRSLEGELERKSMNALEWGRWKKVYVSFADENGKFAPPEYTIPDPEDDDPETQEGS